jgi:hypothetical protein
MATFRKIGKLASKMDRRAYGNVSPAKLKLENYCQCISTGQASLGSTQQFLTRRSSDGKKGCHDLGKEYQGLEDLVDGGLEHEIQQQIPSKSGTELLDELEAEIKATEKYQGLGGKISRLLEQICQELREKINAKRLEALNHALRAAGKSEKTAPQGSRPISRLSTHMKALTLR